MGEQKRPRRREPFQLDVRWRNFRAFQDSGWLSIAPVTVVLGPNNSGKSSLLAPLLLLKQSLDQERPRETLVTKGDYIDLGSYEAFVRDHDTSSTVEFALRWSYHDAKAHRQSGKPPRDLGSEPPGSITVSFALVGDRICVQSYQVHDRFGRSMLLRQRLDGGSYSLEHMEWSIDRRDDDEPSIVDADLVTAAVGDQPTNFMFTGANVIDQMGTRVGRQRKMRTLAQEDVTFLPETYLMLAVYVQSHVVGLLSRLDYVGPFREPPQRYYEVPAGLPQVVGPTGKDAPAIFCRSSESTKRRVNRWLRILHPGVRLECRPLAGGLTELTVARGSRVANLADTGYGLSQVLPILVAGSGGGPLASRSERRRVRHLLILEQPEIHLNPRVQSRLADVVAEMLRQDVIACIETHSEHFLMRLRALVARSGEPKSRDVAIYFVEMARQRSRVKRIPMDELGRIDTADWPSNFFDEALRGALGLADAQLSSSEARPE